jgi:hypothetical protein
MPWDAHVSSTFKNSSDLDGNYLERERETQDNKTMLFSIVFSVN